MNGRLVLVAAIAAAIVIMLVPMVGDDPVGTATPDGGSPATPISQLSTSPSTAPATTAIISPSSSAMASVDQLIADLIAGLTPRQRAAQLLLVGAAGTDPADAAAEAVGDPCLGGYFLTRSNSNWLPEDSAAAARASIERVRTAATACPFGPLIATDAEPGTTVLRVPVTPMPDPKQLVSTYLADPQAGRATIIEISEAFARQLAELGINLNLGIVADVDRSADSYVRRTGRSFGDDPAVVSAISTALVAGHCQAGVAATLKHFPNQGASSADPHRTATVADVDIEDWFTVGAVPYQATRAPVVMVGHLGFAGLSDPSPASLNSTVIGGWLRGRLGYQGLVISDDLLAMDGLPSDLATAERVVAAVRSGVDLALLVDVDGVAEAIDLLVDRQATDQELAARIEESLTRIVRLKAGLGLVEQIDPAVVELCPLGEEPDQGTRG